MCCILKKRIPIVWSAYCQLMKRFEDDGIGVVEYDKDYNRVVELCDAIYGDGGVLMNECRKKHKLVLFETPDLPVQYGDDYQYKKWNDDTLVAVEGEWSLENILEEMFHYTYEVPMTDCGKKIWNTITQME